MGIEKIKVVTAFDNFNIYVRDKHDPLPIARLIKAIRGNPRLAHKVKKILREMMYTVKKCLEMNVEYSCFYLLEEFYIRIFNKRFRLVDEENVYIDKILDNLYMVNVYCLDCDYPIHSYVVRFSDGGYNRRELIRFVRNECRKDGYICYDIHDLKTMIWRILTEIQTEK